MACSNSATNSVFTVTITETTCILVSGSWLVVGGRARRLSLLPCRSLSLAFNHEPPTTNHQPPTTNHQPPTTNQHGHYWIHRPWTDGPSDGEEPVEGRLPGRRPQPEPGPGEGSRRL